MANCTLPHAFGFHRWFEARFSHICCQHDIHYQAGMDRRKADLLLASAIMVRGYPVLAVVTYMAVRLVGWRHYKRATLA